MQRVSTCIIICLIAYNLRWAEASLVEALQQVVEKAVPNYLDGNNSVTKPTELDILNQVGFLSSLKAEPRNGKKTTEWAQQLVRKFQSYGLRAELDEGSLRKVQEWAERTNKKPIRRRINNVVALLEGTSIKNSTITEIFILVSHYNAWDNSPGREARLSGMVALLETARLLTTNATFFPKHSILFVALDWQDRPEIAASYFVDNSLEPISKTEAKFSGVLAFGSVLLYDGSANTQEIPNEYKEKFPKEVQKILKTGKKGDWLASSQFGAPSVGSVFHSYWNKLGDKEFKVYPLVWKTEPQPDSSIYKTAVIPFYLSEGLSSLYLTDTYYNRDPLRTCLKKKSVCNEMKLLNLENLKFLKKIIYAAVLTALDLSDASYVRKVALAILEPPTNKTDEQKTEKDAHPVRLDVFGIRSPHPKATFYWLKQQYKFLWELDKNPSENAWYKGLVAHFRKYGLSVHLENGHENEVESWAVENEYQVVKNPIQNVIARLKGSRLNNASTGIKTKVFIVCSHYRANDKTMAKEARLSGTVALMEISRLIAYSKFKPKSDILFVALDRKHDAVYAANYFMDKYFDRLRNDMNVAFEGALILDTIYNYNLDRNSQTIPQGFSKVFPEAEKDIKDEGSKGNFLVSYQFGQEPVEVNFFWEKLDFDQINLLNLRVPQAKWVEEKHLFKNSAVMPFYKFSKSEDTRRNILMLSDTGADRVPGEHCDDDLPCPNAKGMNMSRMALRLLHKATSLSILTCLKRSEAEYLQQPNNMWEHMYDWISRNIILENA